MNASRGRSNRLHAASLASTISPDESMMSMTAGEPSKMIRRMRSRRQALIAAYCSRRRNRFIDSPPIETMTQNSDTSATLRGLTSAWLHSATSIVPASDSTAATRPAIRPRRAALAMTAATQNRNGRFTAIRVCASQVALSAATPEAAATNHPVSGSASAASSSIISQKRCIAHLGPFRFYSVLNAWLVNNVGGRRYV